MIEDQNLRQSRVSLIVPVLNEESTVRHFVERVDGALADWIEGRPEFEFIFVDDGSKDHTALVLTELGKQDERIKLIRLSRNFGKEAALCAGLRFASGDAAIPMDVDLQDPPELIRQMVARWRGGAKVVNAKRRARDEDTAFKRVSARIFYKAINALSEFPVAEDVGDFRLFDRCAFEILNSMSESSRFNKGIFSWIGFATETIEFDRPARAIGQSKWGLGKLANLALDGLVSTTTLPLRIWTWVGSVIAICAFAYATFVMTRTLIYGVEAPGYASTMVVILFLGGLNLLSLGVMGEYIGRISTQVRGRPLYIVAERIGFD